MGWINITYSRVEGLLDGENGFNEILRKELIRRVKGYGGPVRLSEGRDGYIFEDSQSTEAVAAIRETCDRFGLDFNIVKNEVCICPRCFP